MKTIAKLFFAAACYNMDVTEDQSHPNKLRFAGTLVRLNETSDLAPHGSDDHKIHITSDLAKKRASTIVGMGLNYYPDLTQHAPRRKVGVITKAWVEGNDFKVQGIIWKKDFPEVMDEIRGNSRLGMSMELADVRVNDKGDNVWELDDFKFTGASALWKKSAAYHKTTLAAAAAGERSPFMAKEREKPGGGVGISAAAIGKSVADALSAGMKPMLVAFNKQTKMLGSLTSEIRDMRASAALRTQEEEVEEILAGARTATNEADDDDDEEVSAAADEEEVTDDDDDVAAAGKKKMAAKFEKKGDAANDDEPDDDDDDEESDDDVDAALEDLEPKDAEEEPGEVNKRRGGKNKGSKTTVTAAAQAGLSQKVIKSIRAQSTELATLRAAAEKKDRVIQKMNNKITALQAQATRFAESVERKSVPPELRALLTKGGFDVADMQATGVKLTVEQLDEVISNAGINFSIKDRYALKNVLYQRNLLERGDVVR